MEEEEISAEIKGKIGKNIEKVFDRFLSKGESIEGLIKALIVERVMNILGALIRRPVVKKIAKRAVKKAVNRYWETHREEINLKIDSLQSTK